jgi:hypothetical protein
MTTFDERSNEDLERAGLMTGLLNWGMKPGELHEILYGDPRRVHEARVQAEARVALRKLDRLLIRSWVVPVVDWLARRIGRRPQH